LKMIWLMFIQSTFLRILGYNGSYVACMAEIIGKRSGDWDGNLVAQTQVHRVSIIRAVFSTNFLEARCWFRINNETPLIKRFVHLVI